MKGDPAAGKAIYYGKGGCTNCHMIRGEGGYLGPDLTNFGMDRNVSQLREGVLEPNKRFTDGFRPVVVTLTDGTSRSRASPRTTATIRLQLLDGKGR